MENLYQYVIFGIYILLLIVINRLHQRDTVKLREDSSRRIDKMMGEYDKLMLKFMAISQDDKQKIFEIESKRLEIEGSQVEAQSKYVVNEGKRLDYINQGNGGGMENDEMLKRLREDAQRNMAHDINPTQDI